VKRRFFRGAPRVVVVMDRHKSTNKPGKLSIVAPLRQWSQYWAMHSGTRRVVQPPTARNERVTHQESGGVEATHVRTYNISLQRAVNDKVLTSSAGGRPAELGR
jgi:hypothetical protein